MRPGDFQLPLMLVVFTSRTRKCRSRLQFEMGSATGLEPEEVDTDHELFRTIASRDVQAADQDRDHDMESSSEDEDGDGRTYASDSEPDGACYDGFDDRLTFSCLQITTPDHRRGHLQGQWHVQSALLMLRVLPVLQRAAHLQLHLMPNDIPPSFASLLEVLFGALA